ncbi:LysR family transcriptional regulator [Desulfuromonas versatilis]|uniref:LysR family transcriptional regulator n=2 Tax=Desulfuromonas versatilis TaxID=2802975 RepID=A0ABN6DWV3_9BACT|nr:LysR family transcriptional regulator [Desulfuromonas versatilis]
MIAREANLTRAAERLHLSQSALSSQLKQLEEDLGVALFLRTPRGMVLSEAGRELFPFVEAVLDAEETLARKAQTLRQGGAETLIIGLNTDPAFLRIGAINRRLGVLHSGLNVVFVASQTFRAAQMLRQGQLDLAFCYGDPADPGIRYHHLAKIPFCIAIPSRLIKSGRPRNWAEIAALPWVWVEQNSPPYQAVFHELERRRLLPNQGVKAVDEYIVKELVLDGQGVAVMREDEARPLVEDDRVVLWEKGWFALPLSLAWMARDESRKRVRAAREAIEHTWSAGGEPGEGALSRICY